MKFVIAPFQNLYLNRSLLRKMARSEMQKRTAGSALGNLWNILSPLLFMLVYTVTYAYVLKIRPSELSFNAYMIHLFAGLLPFLAISEVLSSSVSAIRTNQDLLSNAGFPTEVLPVKTVLVSLVALLWGLVLLLIGSTYFVGMDLKMLFIIGVIPMHFLFMSGIGFMLSILGTLLKDMQQLITYVSMIAMLASPIAYTENMVPLNLRFYILLNPFTYLIQSYQSCFVPGYFSLRSMIIFSAISVFTFYLGFHLFIRVKKIVAIYGQ